MKTYYSLRFTSIITLILALGAINPLHASPYSDAQNQPSWFQDQEPATIPQPGGDGPGGWSPVEPDNSPEPQQPDPEAQEPVNLHLTSSAFANGESIPVKYTCDGANVSPQLNWGTVPTGTKSLVLLVSDTTGKSYWVVHSVAPTVRSLAEAFPVAGGTSGGVSQGLNNFGIIGYSGPCPNLTSASVTLNFTLMALDKAPEFKPTQVTYTQSVWDSAIGGYVTQTFTTGGISYQSVIEMAINHVIGKSTLTGTYKRTIAPLDLKSSEFNNGESIPVKFTCDGDNVSPQLNWTGVPQGAKSLVLLVTDAKGKYLWVVYNIDGTVTNLPQAITNAPIANGIYQGTNDSTVVGYSGPCPTTSEINQTLTYTFTLIALNNVPSAFTGPDGKPILTPGTATGVSVLEATNEHVIGLGMLTGTYKRTTAAINLQSSAFINGANIPSKYTCDGANVSPPLNWDDKTVPAGTKSLVLITTNAATGKSAWVAFGIIPPTKELPEAIPNVAMTNGILQGLNGNDPQQIGYSGPCPDSDGATVTYNFTLMALSTIPTLEPGVADMAKLTAAANGNILGVGNLTGTYNRNTVTMTLSSSAFGNGSNIPVKYTCDGADVSPPLSWSGAPDSTKSLILLVTDSSNGKSQWVAFNIGADKTALPEAVPNSASANGISQGLNDATTPTIGYSGPCPISFNDTKTFSFTIIALNKTLPSLTPGVSKYEDVIGAAKDNIVGSGSMTGKYTRQVTTGMTLTSSAFTNNGNIPIAHTCDGANTSPPLSWSGIPETAKSLVLLATNASGAARWVAFNIAKDSTGLPVAIPNTANANGISQGPHDSGTASIIGYEGPCPSAVGGSDTYTFSLTAVNSVLTDLSPGTSDINAVQTAISGHIVGTATLTGNYTRTNATMTLHSSAFANGEAIPIKYTSEGANISPPLSWSDVPTNTKSLVLLMTNANPADPTKKVHWVAFSIPPSTNSLPEGIPNTAVTNGFAQGVNDFNAAVGYYGPYLTQIGVTNSYTFTVMALNNVPNLAAGSVTMSALMTAINGHVIGSGALTGTYQRTTAVMTLHSSAFTNGGSIPAKYTCDGDNVSPPLDWSGAPATTRSFVVLATNNATGGAHWVAFNIGLTVNSLPEAIPNAASANGISQGLNDLTSPTIGYTGPCPYISGSYSFTVIALSKILNLTPGVARYTDVLTAASDSIVGSGSMTGKYTRQVTTGMTLTSSGINAKGEINVEHTCDGANTSPPLSWSGIPETAKSLVLLTTNASGAARWVAFNIAKDSTGLPVAIPNTANANGISQGPHDSGTSSIIGYEGPCPSAVGGSDTYTFSLTAVNSVLTDLSPGTSNMNAVQSAINGHVVGSATLTGNYSRTAAAMTLHSSAFNNGEAIPVKYTSDGANISPPLSWSGVPTNAKSLVLLMTNANPADPTKKVHWVAFSIPPSTNSLPEGIPNTAVTNGFAQGVNDFNAAVGYYGPYLTQIGVTNSYTFTVMALNNVPNLAAGSVTMSDLMTAINGHVIGSGALTGTYNRATTAMTLTSSAFSNGGNMPVKYTCDGANVSPPLSWSGEPDSTKSFIMLVTSAGKSRWIVFNIGADKNSLSENATGLSQGVNDSGATGYTGPCPDLVNDIETYSFTIIAVNKTLAVASGASYTEVLSGVTNNIVGSGSMTGKYTRQVTTGMTLTSSAFTNNGNIPIAHTCDGANTSPPLSWGGIPETAKSLVLLATNANGAARWVAFNIAKDSPGSLPAAIPNTPNANGLSQGKNDRSPATIGYSGPCPATDDSDNTYTFTLVALNYVATDLIPGISTKDDIASAIAGHLVGATTLTGTYTHTTVAMTLHSSAFANGEAIPIKYTSEGANISPPLSWSDVPANTKSLVLLMTNANPADPAKKVHWVAFSIPPSTNSLPEGIPNTAVTNGFAQGVNDFNAAVGYYGPYLTQIGVTNSYTFTVMALNNVPNLAAGSATMSDLMTAINGHVIGSGSLTGTYQRTTAVMTLQSSAFTNGAAIPVQYTCDGVDVSPPLSWSGAPATTKSLALVMIDTTRKAHWVAFNINSSINSLPESVPNAAMTDGISQGGNGFNVIGYSGPCPTAANVANNYSFTIMALDKPLDLTPGFLTTNYESVMVAVTGHIIGSGSLSGTYRRTTGTMTLTSSAFTEGATIPPDHTCVGDATGRYTSPPLAWTGVPSGTQSLVLLTTDASAASGQRSQWVVYNLSPTATSLAAGIPNVATYNGFLQGNNDFGSIGYAAPCPAIGDPAHNYVFSLMALDTTINQSANATYASIFAATAGHLIDMAQLTGTVVRPASGSNFSLHSVFTDGGDIPQLYTCDGSSLSPPLNWDHIPASTKSLVLTLTGTGAPDVDGIVNPSACHWAAFNIPATQNQLAQGQVNTFFTGKFYQAQNYQTTAAYPFYGYAAPCPKPKTTGYYLFNLTTLNQQLTDLDMASTCDEVIATVSGNSVLATASLAGQYVRKDVQGDQLSLSSSALTDGGTIPTQYTCDGANISLPLNWKNVPTDANDPTKNTQTLAIVMTDGDADTTAGEPVAHWIAYDIPTTQISLPENMPRLPLIYNTYQGINDFELVGYNGPCPNPGDGAHRYLIEIFALNAKLNINSADMNYDVFLDKTRDKIIETATLKGTYTREAAPAAFNLTSTAFNFGEAIPQVYTCDGSNKSPPLQWTNPPANTQAFAMLMTDFNASVGTNAHWVLYNVPKTVLSLAEGVLVGASPNPPGGTSAQGFNDFDVQGYSGPCPAAGSGVHQYIFELVALSESITGLTNPTYASVKQAMNGKILGTVKLNGTYSRQVDGAFKLTSPAFADGAKLPDKYRSSYAFPIWDIVIASDKKYYVHRYDDVYSGNATINDDLQVVNDLEAKNISPPLQWDNVPNGTKSLMLLVKSSSAPDVTTAPWEGNTHWIMYDIPPTIDRLDENVAQIPFTIGAYNGVNDSPWGVGLDSPQATPQNNISTHSGGYFIYDSSAAAGEAISQNYWEGHFNGYWGPSRPGRYVFSLVALDKMLELDPSNTTYTSYNTNGVTHTGLIQETLGHIIGTAELLTTKITGPVVTTPINMLLSAISASGANDVEYHATAFDEIDGPLEATCTPPTGDNHFDFGTHYIVCEATNSAGETGTDTFTIIVADLTPPVITVPGDITVTADAGANGKKVDFITEVHAIDNVDTPEQITITCDPSSGSFFTIAGSPHTVKCTATDRSGNKSDEKTFNIIVNDTQ